MVGYWSVTCKRNVMCWRQIKFKIGSTRLFDGFLPTDT